MTELRAAAERALEALNESRDDVNEVLNGYLHGEGYPRFDRRIKQYREQLGRHDAAIDALRTALAEQPQPEAPSGWRMVPVEPTEAMLRAATECDREYEQRMGLPTATGNVGAYDHYCAMIEAAPPTSAPEPSEAELPPLPIGEAEVVWHEPDPILPERPGKIIDASMAFFDAAPLGTHLYTAEQMREFAREALRAAAKARGGREHDGPGGTIRWPHDSEGTPT